MNRRSFFYRVIINATTVLPLSFLSYCPVKQRVITPKTNDINLVGYKGSQFLECGHIYAPYIPLQTS